MGITVQTSFEKEFASREGGQRSEEKGEEVESIIMKSSLIFIALAFLIGAVHMAPLDNVDVHAGHNHGKHEGHTHGSHDDHEVKCKGKSHEDEDHDDEIHGDNSHEHEEHDEDHDEEHNHNDHGHNGHDDFCKGKEN